MIVKILKRVTFVCMIDVRLDASNSEVLFAKVMLPVLILVQQVNSSETECFICGIRF